MNVYTTAPLEDPRKVPELFERLEEIGYDGAFSFEAKHDPFLPLAIAGRTTKRMRLGTAVAIAFARNPMNLANLSYDLQLLTEGRFILGLGSQVRPHIEKRFSSQYDKPVSRMRELVTAIRQIWDCWEGKGPLDFRGEHYRHTLMIPAFDPGPNPYGPPKIFMAGVKPKMTELGGEVGDGFLIHPFNTRRSLEELTLPALERGLKRAGRRREDLEVVCVSIVVAADEPGELDRIKSAVRKQLAFYGSTPAYAPVLECHGWGDLHLELNALSKKGDWDAMAERIDDEILETVAIVGSRREVAAKLTARAGGLADSLSLTNNRAPDASQWADVVADLKRGPTAG